MVAFARNNRIGSYHENATRGHQPHGTPPLATVQFSDAVDRTRLFLHSGVMVPPSSVCLRFGLYGS
ncbi:hypothetical protein [Azospirillum griseum]|uniref:Uncharacterized protein n=1 Tax=Azospirillum griseum TaxID=2496639 RepID=A0A431VL99_9PROT|nr:hypothetical protein [Azospirillum griseum]RTR23479.1 hypothetical protein EJ903_02790 [Azospirillum griseum]